MKIAVYTICRNEKKNILPWLENVEDADIAVVGDTGSNDGSAELLRGNGALVFPIHVSPWRFDEARNRLLRLLPEDVDVCVSLDFDERLSPGWRSAIERAWAGGAARLSYDYIEKNPNIQNHTVKIVSSRIHARAGYIWIYPVHELLSYTGQGQERQAYAEGLTVTHMPDPSKDRTPYLALMELAAAENPDDARILHQLGRDYMQSGHYDKCIETMWLAAALTTIPDEQRRACTRFIARAYGGKKNYLKARKYLQKLIAEAPFCSAAYVEHVILSYQFDEWDDIIALSKRFGDIDFEYKSIYNEFASHEGTLCDITSIAFYHRAEYGTALEYALKALEKESTSERIKQNAETFEYLLKAQQEEPLHE